MTENESQANYLAFSKHFQNVDKLINEEKYRKLAEAIALTIEEKYSIILWRLSPELDAILSGLLECISKKELDVILQTSTEFSDYWQKESSQYFISSFLLKNAPREKEKRDEKILNSILKYIDAYQISKNWPYSPEEFLFENVIHISENIKGLPNNLKPFEQKFKELLLLAMVKKNNFKISIVDEASRERALWWAASRESVGNCLVVENMADPSFFQALVNFWKPNFTRGIDFSSLQVEPGIFVELMKKNPEYFSNKSITYDALKKCFHVENSTIYPSLKIQGELSSDNIKLINELISLFSKPENTLELYDGAFHPKLVIKAQNLREIKIENQTITDDHIRQLEASPLTALGRFSASARDYSQT